MKRLFALLLTITLAVSFCACGQDSDYYDQFKTPENGIFNAPNKFYAEWDIQSVRDISIQLDGHYSMPVYMLETQEELLHLKEIVGLDVIGNERSDSEDCDICPYSTPCEHYKYGKQFFENYVLLVGWHQYAGVILGEHVQADSNGDTSVPDAEGSEEPQSESVSVATYEITPDGSLVVYLEGQAADSSNTAQQWVLVSVPKSVIADCDSIAFLVELPTAE